MEHYTTIGIDVSDRTSKVCVMARIGGQRRIVEETTVATTKEAFRAYLERKDRSWPVTFETGAHCRWMERTISKMGFKVYVANPAYMRALTGSVTKNDRNDARELARYTLADVELLHPVRLRDEPYQQMLRLLKARDGAIAIRTMVINQMRGFAKSMGFRLEKCSAGRFHLLNKAEWPTDFESLTFPLMDILETVALKIKAFDSMIEDLAGTPEFKPMVERCRQVYGVGKIGSVAFVAIIGGNPNRFEHARDVGPYLGLVPKQDQSGESEKQKRMTKHGSKLVRKLLMECAKIAKKDCAKDTDLKLKAMRISRSGGKAARNKATAAVARGLAVVMMALLKDPARKYVPLSERGRLELERLQREDETIEAMQMAS
mgnify:CR=1 FL=1